MSKIIFLSGRFRSGTSMLWNIFNQLPEYCAYYEPLHPNLISHIQHVKPKEDHLDIDDYWRNYLHLTELKEHFSNRFGQQDIFLEKHEKWIELEQYIRYLITSAGDKTPVLQFNRMDLRLSWLKNTFPNATIIHINRNVFPLWVSSRRHLNNNQDKKNESHPDAYDLMQWSADLSLKFPMLQTVKNRSSYYRHYFIWKLSQLLAKSHADIHLNLEQDFIQSQSGVDILARKFDWNTDQQKTVKEIIQKPESLQSETKISKDCSEIEKSINSMFKKLGLDKLFPSSPLNEIKLEKTKAWNKYSYHADLNIQELLDGMKYQKDELTALNNRIES